MKKRNTCECPEKCNRVFHSCASFVGNVASAEGDRDAEKALGESDVDHGDDEGVNLGRPRNEDNNGLCLHFWKEGKR